MQGRENTWPLIAGGAAALAVAGAYFARSSTPRPNNKTILTPPVENSKKTVALKQEVKSEDGPSKEEVKSEEVVVLIGDIGGSNVRLCLKRLNLKNRTSVDVKPLTKYASQKVNLKNTITEFIAEFQGTKDMPEVGVIGIAGEVRHNKVNTTNCPHWEIADGDALALDFNMKSFTFINDFAAAGYGVCLLQKNHVTPLNRADVEEGGVKVVMGPGTGLGEGILVKSSFAKCYEVFSSEGGHVDFNVRSQEDWDLRCFAENYICNSNNIENLRGKVEKLDRVSIERLCAGPAVPLIYEFMKTKYPDLPRVLENNDGKKPDDLTSGDIIACGMNTEDELCKKVVRKFAEIFGAEVGNMAMKVLPYGGIYLTGGVCIGIMNFLEHDHHFMHTVQQKGRLSAVARRIPIFVVKPEIELGILGAEECAFRKLGCFGL